MNERTRFLREETVRKIAAPVLDRSFVRHSLDWLPDDYAYGLGVRVRTCDTAWGLQSGEFGWDGAAGAFSMVDTKNKISLTYFQNVLGREPDQTAMRNALYKDLGL